MCFNCYFSHVCDWQSSQVLYWLEFDLYWKTIILPVKKIFFIACFFESKHLSFSVLYLNIGKINADGHFFKIDRYNVILDDLLILDDPDFGSFTIMIIINERYPWCDARFMARTWFQMASRCQMAVYFKCAEIRSV